MDLKDMDINELREQVKEILTELGERGETAGFILLHSLGNEKDWKGTGVTAKSDYVNLERMFSDVGNNPNLQQTTFRMLRGLIFGVLVNTDINTQLIHDASMQAGKMAHDLMQEKAGDQKKKKGGGGLIIGMGGKGEA